MSKTKEIRAELTQQYQRQSEIEALLVVAQKEELAIIDTMKDHINSLSSENGLFIGVILTPEDILGIVQLAMERKENIKIPFNIYLD